ncbi:transglutaminase domain-containing protein [Methanosphaera sp. ISO3-F5]|uniref:transglutaminase domain-containing protein n=1 Tax=Methanosphaera sp. ISO3-F5 TaxID=1452353 RepID=UPI002B25CCA8|nr:transglutaminase domain-containing protein [Methanosphaera sp. ISO3-F5]WQH64595.1 transglutaminase domain-containing protein [Methanosphaera sp. ISO3-F5]
MVLFVSILLSISAISATDSNENTTTNDLTSDVVTNTQTESNTNIESNSIKNTVSNEYEAITNDISSDEKTISKQSTNNSNTKTAANKEKVIITSQPITSYANQLITIKASVTYQNGEILKDAKTAIKINGNTIGHPRVTNGIISFNYMLPKWHAKEYDISITVGETSETATTKATSSLLIKRHNVIVTLEDSEVLSAAKTTLKANVKYEDGTPVNSTKAVFKINGKTIGSTIVQNGVASITCVVPAKAKTYPLILKIGETTVSSYKETSAKLVVKKRTPKIDVDSLIFVKEGYTVTLRAKLTDVGYADATGKLGFKINGKTVATVKMVDSTAEYKYDSSKLDKENYVVTVVYGGSGALNEVRKNTTLRVQSDLVSTYTYAQLLEKGVSVRDFIKNNNRLPNYAAIGGNEVSMADLLYMYTQMLTYNNSFHNGGFSTPSSSASTSQYNINFYTKDYMALAKTIVDSYIENGRAPKTMKSDSGLTLSFTDAVYAYSRVIGYLAEHNRLPNYVGIDKISSSSSSSSSGSSSSSSSSSNSGSATNNDVPSGFEQYLGSAKNAAVNSTTMYNAVKKAISGATSLYAQAKAIFDYVNAVTDYQFYMNTRYGALGTLSRGYGNCVDQSHVLIGMFRTARLPARYCHATCYFTSGLVVGHVWTEVYVNGQWYKCDTTSSRNTFGVINNWYKSSTVKRYTSISF